ncbi:MAG: PAS domain S-box protein [Pseudomonadota bacterium]
MVKNLQPDAEGAFAFLAAHTSDVIVRATPEGELTYVSPTIRRYGYEPEQLIRAGGAVVHPDDAEHFAAANAALFRGELDRSATREHRFRAADGSWVWMEGNPHLVFDEDGRVIEIVNIFRDVTRRRALEVAAQTEAEQFEAAFKCAAIGMALVGLDGSFLRVNEAFCRITGYPCDQMLGLDFQSITHPDDLDADLDLLRRLTEGEIDNYGLDKRYLRSDGAEVLVNLAVSLVRNGDGSPRHYLAQVQDLSGRLAAEAALRESEARFRLIAENTTDMIVMSDLDGRALYASPNLRRMGREAEDMLGRSFTEYTHPDDAPKLAKAFQALIKDEGRTTQIRWRARHARTGACVWLESNPSLVRDEATGRITGFLDVIRDVDAQVEQEAALATARAEAEAAASAKSQFLANMSHEIRTPLTAVLGFTNLLRELELPEAAAGYVRRIAGAGNALLAIVNDILDFSKLEAGKFEIRPRPARIAEVCEETLQLFSNQAETKGLDLTFDVAPGLPQAVLLDADRLRQMLVNLVGNAIKFTEVGRVGLSVEPTPGGLAIEVADTGPGLDDEAQAVLFQRFTQIDGSMTRRHGGAGLGLAISRGIAEAMGGTIAVRSSPGAGAVFRVELPAPAVAAPREADEASPASIEGLRVCVIDDNAVNRELSRRILEAAGAEVREASDGVQGLRLLAVAPVDVVLLDLRMPELDGRSALRRLRSESGPNRDVPVLAFTADADVAAEGDLEGFDGLVRKPIAPLEMYAAIAAAVDWAEDEGAAYAAG